GNQLVLVDRIAHRRGVRPSWQTITPVAAAFVDRLEVDIEIQDGIDIDVVRDAGGNLVTRAARDGPVRSELAGRSGRFRSGVVAQRDGRTSTFEEVLQLQEDVRPRWTKRSCHARVQGEVLVPGQRVDVE